MKLTDDLYVYEWQNPFENNCNSFYIGGDVQAVIDPGLSGFFPDLLVRMQADGIEREHIRYVINTHCHPDHFEASEHFNDDETVAVCLLDEEMNFYNEAGKDMYQMFGLRAPVITVDRILKAGSLTLGSETFEVLHVPGHSPGSLALYWPSVKALFPGDVVFYQSVGRTDFHGGSGSQLKESIRKLSSLDVEYLLPGHMDILTGRDAVADNFRLIINHVFPYIA